MKMGYPTKDEEIEVLTRTQKQAPIEGLDSVISLDELVELQDQVKKRFMLITQSKTLYCRAFSLYKNP